MRREIKNFRSCGRRANLCDAEFRFLEVREVFMEADSDSIIRPVVRGFEEIEFFEV